MTSLTRRRGRIMRIRKTEHRAATARLAEADNSLAKLRNVEARILKLRATAHMAKGLHSGPAMLATGEMQLRLVTAGRAVAASKEEAETKRNEERKLEQLAHQRKESSAKLLSKSRREDAAKRERMLDANRPRPREFRRIGEPS